MNMKTLSVITTTDNRAYCLHQVYDSLCRQTSKDFIWLIIDDGSTDDTADVVKEKTPEVKEKFNEAFQQVSDFASEKIPGVTTAVQNVVDKIAEKAPEVNEKIHEAVEKVSERVINFAEAVKEEEQDAESSFEDVVDAEVESFEENKEEPKE